MTISLLSTTESARCRPIDGRLAKIVTVRYRVDRGTVLESGTIVVSVFPPIASDNPAVSGLPSTAPTPMQTASRDIPGNTPNDQQIIDDEARFTLPANRTYRLRIQFTRPGLEFPLTVDGVVAVQACDCSLVDKYLDQTTIKIVDKGGNDVSARWHDGLCLDSESVTVTVVPPTPDIPVRWITPAAAAATVTIPLAAPDASDRTVSARFEVGFDGCPEPRDLKIERCEGPPPPKTKTIPLCSVVDCSWSLSVWKISVIVGVLAFYFGLAMTVFHGARSGFLFAASDAATATAAQSGTAATTTSGATAGVTAAAALQAVMLKLGAYFDLTIAIVGVLCLIFFACSIVLGAVTCWLWWTCCKADWCRLNSNLEWSLDWVLRLSALLGIIVAFVEFLFVAPRMASEPGSAVATAAAMGVYLALLWVVFLFFRDQVRTVRQQEGCRELRWYDPPWEG
jgi:hypothetical protein